MGKFTIIQCLVAIFLLGHVVNAQDQNEGIDLISAYKDYTEMDRELVYAHLNKSIYVKGETIGIKAYVLDKYSKTLASQAANLYCTISDDKGVLIEQKLLMVENGIATGDFEINDSYTSGYYSVKLYTNWMRNFEEENLFIETVRVIDPEVEKKLDSEIDTKTIDAQFLPEGGHLLSEVENTIGVIIKNSQGLGIPNIEGEIINQNGVVVTNFKVNHLGIGKCLLTPKTGETYKAVFKSESQEYSTDIDAIKTRGIALSVTPLRGKVALKIKTNATTLERISQNLFKLAIHNGKNLKEISFKFDETSEVIKVIDNPDLYKGVNIFTIFDGKNNPLVERLYFNHDGLEMITSGVPSTTVNQDSIKITLPYTIDEIKSANAVSISVLPSKTNAFHHHNMASYILLQPYLKGYIEQAQYYFTDITPKKQFELDNLLITQGWSSYDWDTIFNNPPEYDFDYENGIGFTVNSSEKEDQQLMIYPTLNHSTKFISLTKDNPSYTASGLFPLQDEVIRIRSIDGISKKVKPQLYMQFDPIKVPELNTSLQPLIIAKLNSEAPYVDLSTSNILQKVEKLDEVIINKKKGYTEIEKLKNRSLGNVEAIDETIVKRYRTLVRYLRDKGWTISDAPGKFEIYNNQTSGFQERAVQVDGITFQNVENPSNTNVPDAPSLDDHTLFVQNATTIPIVYLDGIILHEDLTILKSLTLDQIEWVEVNKSGVGGGMRSGGAGLIRIKTRPGSKVKASVDDNYGTYQVPLKFSAAKKFYIPEYVSYDNAFFNKFGVIDWFPNLSVNSDGTIEFKIENKQFSEIKLVVEGIVNNAFVSEVKTIKLN
ncbi:hypothetical protein [Psychroserpens algicola]|uniref:TonB-dependent receptor plug domain-containing protein n=1 Tax=Psychroserpens algicola TaxID=1719034 RepID=A0ABT0HCN9_9FLAO|nr:hypothetical protein [Psychroserpens algicola]MCK8481597.1 hypothetical protein [Psychroserpens algicola]